MGTISAVKIQHPDEVVGDDAPWGSQFPALDMLQPFAHDGLVMRGYEPSVLVTACAAEMKPLYISVLAAFLFEVFWR